MQATLEAETKGKQEALRIKKKLESDINELEIALDHANKAYADAQKTIKRQQEQIRELQLQVEEEQRIRDDLRDQLFNAGMKYLITKQLITKFKSETISMQSTLNIRIYLI